MIAESKSVDPKSEPPLSIFAENDFGTVSAADSSSLV